ncbi:MAG: Tungsten-containing aldehyde ferredoxin oxidoreductase [Candidatus Bathyarchaeota archaeon BA1]|nr:MAG: Tungsten-containing aldehyde ferredoxin oxidoreductase [Candidatus Bathyarchaeota archaeon BA1]
MYGFNNKVLRVDLTDNDLKVEESDEKVFRKYLGGRGLALHFLLKELKPRVDPLGPENKLIFATSVTTGIPLPGFCRYSVVAKSPLTGGFGEAEAGGFWGPELKFAGFDIIIVEGASKKPVYVWVHDGEAEIKDASHVWGKTTKEAQEAIREQIGDPLVRVALIGPAGEKLIRFACILNELKFANGRGGLGAVMGSKNLKAIAVRGRKRVECKDLDKVRGFARWFSENWRKYLPTVARSKYGTAEIVLPLNADGILPTRNFNEGTFGEAERISGEEMKNTIVVDSEGCFACPVRCKRVVKGAEPHVTDPSYGGPEYETIAAFGSLCAVSDISSVAFANQLCNAYGLDTISTGCVIAFAMECYENGIIKRDETKGLELKFGNVNAMIKLTEMIAKREGLGDVLAEGVKRASEKIGKGAERYALHVKGKEIPLHEPRGKTGLALQYALSPSGADHLQAAHDPAFEKSVKDIEPFGILETVDRLSLGPDKVRLFKYLHLWWSLLDCLCVCKFVFLPHPVGVFKVNHLTEIVNAVTGWETSLLELMNAAERSLISARIFNIREGFTSLDDWLPERFFNPLRSSPREGAKISRDDLREAIKLFYEMMGWDEKNGEPKLAKLHELGLPQ